MSKTFKARPTTYRGIQMRSRLEAGFAQWLDGWPIMRWSYEPRAFASERGQYFPDFAAEDVRCDWLDGSRRVYFEIKPSTFGIQEAWDDDDHWPGTATYDEGEAAEVALHDRMHIIWDSEPEAALIVVKQRVGGGARFTALMQEDDGGSTAVDVEPAISDWVSLQPAFVVDHRVHPVWPDGYWRSRP